MSACLSQEAPGEEGLVDEAKSPISFHSSTFKAASKTPVIDGNNINTFKVCANLPEPSKTAVMQTIQGKHGFNYFEDIGVLRDQDLWEYTPNVYWPNKTDLLSIYAYAPAGSVNVLGFRSDMNAASPTDNAVVDYQVPSKPGSETMEEEGGKEPEDFLIAVARRAQEDNRPVQLYFRHALAMVAFAARNVTDNIYVTIEKVQLIHLNTHSSLDITQNFNRDSIYWAPADELADYCLGMPLQDDGSYALSLLPEGEQAPYVPLTAPSEQMPVMPQGLKVGNTKAYILKQGEKEPEEPGILVTYHASSPQQLIAPPGTRAYYPFPALYKAPNYGGEPDASGKANDAFALQMGKSYLFTFEFSGSGAPRINFSSVPISM
ncbi:MAG: fimbrillin family protein [Tannerella sp.]|nr:fimbrillin family protein [Tannerella sp.]